MKQFAWFLCWAVVVTPLARAATAPALPDADERYKTDILVIVAHADDESGNIAGYLARAIYDQHRRVAVVFTTRGEEGRNDMGTERGDALGAIRDIEGQQALATLGVMNVWHLNGPNTISQNVLRALERWDHGLVLGQVVRLIRLTRPEVILTWLPASVAGENHADHQASAVIATEAFDLAGDPVAFGEQLMVDREGGGKPAEGLRPWQPKKIYYYSDALEYPDPVFPPLPSPFRSHFLEGKGPVYSMREVSPTQHESYAALSAKETRFYLSEDGRVAVDALKAGDFTNFEQPARFVFGKSLVGGSVTGDIFEGVSQEPIPFARAPVSETSRGDEPALQFGGPWHYYQQFWRSHHIEHLATLLPVPEVAIRPGIDSLRIPLLIRNSSKKVQNVTLAPVLPEGWTDRTVFTDYQLKPGDVYPVQVVLGVPDNSRRRWEEIKWHLTVDGQESAALTLRVFVGAKGAIPQ